MCKCNHGAGAVVSGGRCTKIIAAPTLRAIVGPLTKLLGILYISTSLKRLSKFGHKSVGPGFYSVIRGQILGFPITLSHKIF